MTLQETADMLVKLCREGRDMEALETLYGPDPVSVEAMGYDGQDPVTKGFDGIKAKHVWWNETFEVHSAEVEGPFVHGDDRFAVIFAIDTTNRASGERMAMREVAVYHVADGKIVREEFFYGGA